MNTKYRILGFAALALMSSCSKTRTEAQPDPVTDPTEEAWVTDESMPVPVNFSSPQIGVVSKVNAEEITDLTGLQLGVYGLRTVDGALSWDPSEPDTYITNLLTRVAVVNAPSEPDQKSYLTFKTGETDLTVYYPMVSTNTYSFYGYYPRREAVETVDACTVTYENIGGTDILWAEDHAQAFQDGLKGFNAAYVRQAKKHGVWNNTAMNFTPNFNFQHMLAGLRFYALGEENAEYGDVVVTGLRLVEVPTSVTLAVASTTESGAVTPVADSEGTINLTGASGAALSVTPDRTEYDGKVLGALLGTLMVCPDESYKLEVDVRIGGNPSTIETTIPTRTGGYVAGSMYSLSILVKSPVEVEISVDVTPWDDVDDTPEIEIG